MKRIVRTSSLILLLVALGACESRTDKADGGGVLLSVSDFDGLPTIVSVNTANAVGLVTIEEITIDNIVKDPAGDSSDLMNVEMESYQVTFTRLDTGTRVPDPYFATVFGVAPAGGTIDYENLPILGTAQLTNPPLSDLLFENGGFDKETNDDTIVLNCELVFFGRTLSGDPVATAPANFSIEFRP